MCCSLIQFFSDTSELSFSREKVNFSISHSEVQNAEYTLKGALNFQIQISKQQIDLIKTKLFSQKTSKRVHQRRFLVDIISLWMSITDKTKTSQIPHLILLETDNQDNTTPPSQKKKLLSETKSNLGRRVQVILNFCDCVSKVVYDISTLQASIHDKDQVNKFC